MNADTAVAVVGSANLDVVVHVERFPEPGETVLGSELEQVAGGKGLNQAVSAARHTVTSFVGCVGDDDAGDLLVGSMRRRRVDTAHVMRVRAPSGRALIEVGPGGENRIVVAAGANLTLTAGDVTSALAALRPRTVLSQTEIPLAAVAGAATWAHAHGARFMLNLSPVCEVPESVLAVCDPLIVNAAEAGALLGASAGGSAEGLAQELAQRTVSVVVTDGARGAWVARGNDVELVATEQVAPVDTTGAGDEFAGAMAAALAAGQDLTEAARIANQAAATLVTKARHER